MRLCIRCGLRPPWSPHALATLCVECIDPVDLAHKLRLRAETAAKQRRGKPVRFDVQPYRPHRKGQRHHGPVLVPLPLLAIRGDAMTVQEIAAVLGMSEMGVRLVEQRAMAKFEATWRAMFHREAEAAE